MKKAKEVEHIIAMLEPPQLFIDTVTHKVVGTGKYDIGVGVHLVDNSLRLAVEIKRKTLPEYGYLEYHGERIDCDALYSKDWVSGIGFIGKLSPRQIIERLHYNKDLAHTGLLTPQAKEFFKLEIIDSYIPEEYWGHETAYIIYNIFDKTVKRWWTLCRGPGSSCCYDHPQGLEII